MDRSGRLPFSRWWLVVAGALSMGVAGTYQFGWSSIRGPLGAQVAASETTLGTVFTVFVVFQTVSQFPAGWVRDRYGPRLPLLVGAILLGAGFALASVAGSVAVVVLAYGVGGVGAGIAYTVAINTPVKWFTDRRGTATGVVSVAYGGASFLLIPAVRRGVATSVEATLIALGALCTVTLLVATAVLRDPPGMAVAADGGGERTGDGTAGGAGASEASTGDAHSWTQTIRTWQFWVLYGVFFVVNGVGLMLIGKVVAFGDQFGLAPAIVTASASSVAVFDSLGVLGGGWLSDRIGAVRTSSWSLIACGLVLGGAVLAGGSRLGLAFVVLVGAAEFFRAPVFVIFPGLVGTYYGESRSSANYALLYSAKLWGGVFGGTVASGLVVTLGWSETFGLGAVMLVVAGLAMSLVRPV